MLALAPELVEQELELVSQAQAGDAEAFCDLCRLYEPRLLRQANALCGNAALAEDLAEDTLVEAWKCVRRYNGRCQFFTWLCAILLNRFRNALRQRQPLSIFGFNEGKGLQTHLSGLTDNGTRPDQAAQLRDQNAMVRECVQLLPAKHQQVIYLRFFVDDSLDGIAEALGCSVGTVKSRLFHALEKLRGMKALRADALAFKPE